MCGMARHRRHARWGGTAKGKEGGGGRVEGNEGQEDKGSLTQGTFVTSLQALLQGDSTADLRVFDKRLSPVSEQHPKRAE